MDGDRFIVYIKTEDIHMVQNVGKVCKTRLLKYPNIK